jgi:hypothetical protein
MIHDRYVVLTLVRRPSQNRVDIGAVTCVIMHSSSDVLTAAARVRSQVRSCGICGGRSGIGAGFLQVLRFPLAIIISQTAPHSSSSIIRGWYNRPIVADVASELTVSLTVSPPENTISFPSITNEQWTYLSEGNEF